MAKTLEELTQEIFDECIRDSEPITMEEAQEMAKMEMGAKEVKNIAQAEHKKERKKREVKQDPKKVVFITKVVEMLKNFNDVDTIEVVNAQKEVLFNYCGESYSLSLIKHRKGKKEE